MVVCSTLKGSRESNRGRILAKDSAACTEPLLSRQLTVTAVKGSRQASQVGQSKGQERAAMSLEILPTHPRCEQTPS